MEGQKESWVAGILGERGGRQSHSWQQPWKIKDLVGRLLPPTPCGTWSGLLIPGPPFFIWRTRGWVRLVVFRVIFCNSRFFGGLARKWWFSTPLHLRTTSELQRGCSQRRMATGMGTNWTMESGDRSLSLVMPKREAGSP